MFFCWKFYWFRRLLISMSSVPEIRIYSPSGSCQDDHFESTLKPSTDSSPSWITSLLNKETSLVFDKENIDSSSTADDKLDDAERNSKPRMHKVFNKRLSNLANFPVDSIGTYKSHRGRSRFSAYSSTARAGVITNASKSLDILRENLQKYINVEIEQIIKNYLERFFKPAIENIKMNIGANSVTEDHIKTVCRQILEEAKKSYEQSVTRGSSPAGDISDCDSTSQPESRYSSSLRLLAKAPFGRRKESDTDSETSQVVKPKRKKGRPPLHANSSGRSTPSKSNEPVRKEGPKWEPSRLTKDTEFVMGARANKALGLGATRGRLYIKHPEIFKYSGDQDDKQWLYDHSLMPATGGKAYMLTVEDIKDLAQTDEYKNSSQLMMGEIKGFNVPEFILEKMRTFMRTSRTDSSIAAPVVIRKRGRPPGSTNKNHQLESISKKEFNPDDLCDKKQEFEPYFNFALPHSSEAPSPADDLDLLGVDGHSVDQTSPFSNPATSFEVSPMTAPSIGISPTPSELSAVLDPPLSASFDITSSP